MKKWGVIGVMAVIMSLVAVGVGKVAFGQPESGPGGQGMRPMMMPPRADIQYNGGNLYLLQGNKLVKYQGATLKELGTAQLDGSTARNGQPPFAGPAAFLISGNDALVVAGGTFYRVDTRTMKVAKKTALSNQTGQRGAGRQGAPQLVVGGKTLYVLHGDQLCSIDIASGKMLKQVALEQPIPPNRGAKPTQQGAGKGRR